MSETGLGSGSVVGHVPDGLSDLVPGPGCDIDWERIGDRLAGTDFGRLAFTPQNPDFHGEGDVYAHTHMVCEELLRTDGFWGLDEADRQVLFLASLLHDVGKPRTTRLEDGRWTSPHHASVGASQVREFLVRAWGMGGTPSAIAAREFMCWLIRWHMLPPRLIGRDDPFFEARRVAATGDVVSGASWRKLLLLAEADTRGRIAPDVDECVERIDLARLACEEAGCLEGPFAFGGPHVRRSYLKGKAVVPDQPLYDGTWGEVTLMCGLPGTGKDTWISHERAGMPMVSLDEIRLELGIGPTEPQGRVVQEARERARVHLRRHEEFVWNATNTTRLNRQRCVGLFEDYGARVRIVYLETGWETLVARNAVRAARVPQNVVEHLLARLEPPMPDEAHVVEWLCV